MFLKSLKSSQESICAGVFYDKVAGPQNCNFIKKRLQHSFFLEFCELSKSTYLVEDLWTAASETPVHLFNNTFFTEYL